MKLIIFALILTLIHNLIDANMNETMLTVLALSAYFKNIGDIFTHIKPKIKNLQSESSNLPPEADKLLQSLAIR